VRHKRLLAVLGCGVVAATLVAASSPGRSVTPFGPAAPAKGGPLLGLLARGQGDDWTSVLARISPETLRPLRGARLVVGQASSWSFAPDRSLLAIAAPRPAIPARWTLQLIDPRTLKLVARLGLGTGNVWRIAWLRPDRVLALRYRADGSAVDVLVLDPQARTARTTATLNATVIGSEVLPDALVLLIAPVGKVGRASLVVVDADGGIRSVGTDVVAGYEVPPQDEESTPPELRHDVPGLAVDPLGRHAYVVSASGSVADISLDSLSVSYHALSQPVSLLGRLRDFVEPAAEAKEENGPLREAEWLGNGIIAVSGNDAQTYTDKNGSGQFRITPAGLSLIDTRTWTVRKLDRGADAFVRAGDDLLASGIGSDSGTGARSGMGVASYRPNGSQRFHILAGVPVWIDQAWGGRAFITVRDYTDVRVMDTTTGLILGKRNGANIPRLLVGGSG
jgi:hypothetical protein